MKWIALILFASPAMGQNCVPPVMLSPNDAQSGELAAASCQLSDGTKVSEYRLTLPTRGTLLLNAKATGFNPSFVIRDPDGRKVETGTSISRYMEAGTYTVLLNGTATGKFSFTSVFQPEPNVLCTAFNRVGAGQTITGQLTAASCKLPDGSAFDGWQTTVFGAGTLTITMHAAGFNALLMLRAEDGTLLAFGEHSSADSAALGPDAQITLPVSGRETYTVIAAAASPTDKSGSYQIVTAFSAAADDTCMPVRVLSEPVQISGSVSAASCNFNLPERQDSSLFNIYSLHVAQTGTVEISVPVSSFTPLLLLLDKDGYSIVEDSESGGLYIPYIRQTLPPGDYNVLIYNEDSFEGDYTLQYNFTSSPAPPCSIQSLTSGQTLTGTLNGDTSCRFSELLSDIYRFTLTAPSTVEIGLASSDFTTFLELRDAKDNLLAYSDQTTDGSSAYVKADLPAGTYALAAASVDLPGNYSLNAQITPKAAPPCPAAQNISVNTGFVGKLGQGTCFGLAGEPVDYYRFTTSADGTVALVMTSGDLDSYLILTDSTGKVLRVDDNGYSQNDALIVQFLKAGSYKAEARSRSNPPGGKYRFDLLWTAGARSRMCAAAPLNIGDTVSATLTYTACQYYDDTFADIYRFNVSDSSKPVTLVVSSSAFDSFLILTDSKGNILQTDDNSAGGTDATLTILLDSGAYFAVVKPAGEPSESGSYRLSVRQ